MANVNLVLERDDELESSASRLDDIEAKLDRLLVAVEQLDVRRQELEEFVEDVMPAVNGAMRVAMTRLDQLEKSGALAFATATADALGHVAQTVDPQEIRTLADNAGRALRTANVLSAPELTAIAERTVAALANARRGKPPSLWQLLAARKEPRIRRGAAALLDVLRAIGDGVGSADRQHVQAGAPLPARPAPSPTRPSAGRPVQTSAAACHPSTPASTGHPRQIAGATVDVDAEGFLVNRDQWTRDIAEQLAAEAGIAPLSARHWEVITFCRDDAATTGAAPGLRRITQVSGIAPKEMYALFPKGPGILAARIAGLSKPKSCV